MLNALPSRILFITLAFFASLPTLHAAEVIPPSPPRYFNDYAHVVKTTTADQLNQKLTEFEKQTSNQIVVAIYPKMQSDSSIEDYTQRVAEKWGAGIKKNNGVVLFVFTGDHKVYIQVGYGLEGALPDAVCKQIITNELTPKFKQGDFDGGLASAVDSIIAVTKGEYRGTGATVNQQKGSQAPHGSWVPCLMISLFAGLMIWSMISAKRRGATVFGPGGYRSGWGGVLGGIAGGLGGMSRGGGGFSGGGFSGGGGFTGGGGSFGGGGAGGSW